MATTTKPAGSQDDQRSKYGAGKTPYDSEQARYDREFAGMTGPSQYKKEAIEPDYGIIPDIREKETRPDANPGAEPGKEAAPENINAQEQAGALEPEPSLYQPEGRDEKEKKRPWRYKGKHRAKGVSGIKRGRIAFLAGGALGSLFLIGGIALLLLFLAPYKEVHFAEVLRSIGFARFTHQMNRQFSRVIFDAAVLTDRSTGTFPRGSLMNRLPLINPERQIAQLGRDGAMKWDFAEQRRWGGLLPGQNVYRGVEVFGQYFGLDEMSQELFGTNYDELTRREAMTVRARHANAYREAIDVVLKPLGRSQYWASYRAFHQATGVRLYGWANKAREFFGKTPDQSRTLNIEQDIERSGATDPVRTGIDDIDEDSEEHNRRAIDAAKDGRPTPGQIRNQLASRLKLVTSASDAVFAVTLACIIHTLSDAFEAHEIEREKQVAKWGNVVLSKADQTKAGDVEAEAINAESSMWHGAEQSYLYEQAFERPISTDSQAQALDIPWINVQTKFSDSIQLIDQILTASVLSFIPGVGGVRDAAITKGCNIALSAPAQYITAGVEVAIGVATVGTSKGALTAIRHSVELAVGVVTGIVVADWVGQQIDNVIETASNLDFTGANTGAQRYNESAVSVDYIQQIGNRNINFGRPLTQGETNNSQELAVADLKDRYQNKSFTTRYFAMDNPFSLAGQIAARTPDSTAAVADNARKGLASIGAILTTPARLIGSVASIFTGSNMAKAASVTSPDSSFGVDPWGWSVEEQGKLDNDPAFLPENLARSVEPRLDELNDRYWKCYDQDNYNLQSEKPEDCTREFLSTDDALKWRYYMSYLYVTGRLTGDV